MSFSADAITLTLLAVIAVLVAGILGFAIASRVKVRRRQRDIIAVRATIIDYFRRSGVTVSADCTSSSRRSGQFIAIIESEPMKRFRLSHIIEMTVREHVRKGCGLELEKIYWRFPIKEAAQAVSGVAEPDMDKSQGQDQDRGVASAEAKPQDLSDDYINEGLEHYRHIPKPEVEELPWESFEQVTGGNTVQPKPPESGPNTGS